MGQNGNIALRSCWILSSQLAFSGWFRFNLPSKLPVCVVLIDTINFNKLLSTNSNEDGDLNTPDSFTSQDCQEEDKLPCERTSTWKLLFKRITDGQQTHKTVHNEILDVLYHLRCDAVKWHGSFSKHWAQNARTRTAHKIVCNALS